MLTLRDAYQLFHEGMITLAHIEENGVRVDPGYISSSVATLEGQIASLQRRMEKDEVYKVWRKEYGDKTNLGSREQLAKILFDKMGYEVRERTEKTGRAKVDVTALDYIDLPFLRLFSEAETLKKMKTTYFEGIRTEMVERDGHYWVHPSYSLSGGVMDEKGGAATYRSSCSQPNFMNQPARNERLARMIRSCYLPHPGHHWVEIDFRTLEVRIAYCVTGDTKVETTTGRMSIKKLIDKVNNQEDVYVYGHSRRLGRITAARVTAGGITGRKKEIWEVTLDNGKTVRATPDHKFMMRDGSYKRLRHLGPGDRLMPFWKKKTDEGYVTIRLNNGSGAFGHQIVTRDVLGLDSGGSLGSPMIVHHKDHDKTNNHPTNLDVIRRKDHRRHHPWKHNEETRRKISEIKKGTPAHNKGKPGKPLALWHVEKLREVNRTRIRTPEERARLSENKKSYWKNKPNETCQICGHEMRKVSNTHLRKHGLSPESYKEYVRENNHKVISVRFFGHEDVYNINVEGIHNYAVGAGIIVKNCYHKDPVMRDYLTKPGTDMHRDMMIQCYQLPKDSDHSKDKMLKKCRNVVKADFVFASFYGSVYFQTAKRLWDEIDHHRLTAGDGGLPMKEHLKSKGITELGECDPAVLKRTGTRPGTFVHYIKTVEEDFWGNRFRVYDRWKTQWYQKYLRTGGFRTHTGFEIHQILKKNDVINYPVQASAFHCLLWCLNKIDRWIRKYKMKSRIIGEVHDSGDFSVPPAELDDFINYCVWVMTEALPKAWPWITIPMEVEVEVCDPDESWAVKKEWAQRSGHWSLKA